MVYCCRCERLFRSFSGWQQHIRTSKRHNVCHICGYDNETSAELNDHLEDHHDYCFRCDEKCDDWEALRQHKYLDHHICYECGREFDSESKVRNHSLTHLPKTMECFGCDRKFATKFAIILHLETGTCPSGTDCDKVTDLAMSCRQSRHYMSDDPDYDFKCPTCDTDFRFMSGLIQHVESAACNAGLGKKSPLAIFLRFLEARV